MLASTITSHSKDLFPYQELIDAHARINGNLAAKVALKFLLGNGAGSIIRQKLCQTLRSEYFNKIHLSEERKQREEEAKNGRHKKGERRRENQNKKERQKERRQRRKKRWMTLMPMADSRIWAVFPPIPLPCSICCFLRRLQSFRHREREREREKERAGTGEADFWDLHNLQTWPPNYSEFSFIFTNAPEPPDTQGPAQAELSRQRP